MATEAQPAKQAKLLVVEDDVFVRMLLADMLSEIGYTVAAEAANIDEALAGPQRASSQTRIAHGERLDGHVEEGCTDHALFDFRCSCQASAWNDTRRLRRPASDAIYRRRLPRRTALPLRSCFSPLSASDAGSGAAVSDMKRAATG